MAKINHLKRIANILWDHHSEEIQEEKDWYFACKHWEINFTFDDDSQTIVAYKRKGCETDWSKAPEGATHYLPSCKVFSLLLDFPDIRRLSYGL